MVDPLISAYMAELGKKGGSEGGKTRARNLTQEQRSEIAKKAAEARWEKKAKADLKEAATKKAGTKKAASKKTKAS